MTQPIVFQRLEGALIFIVATALYMLDSYTNWLWFIPALFVVDITCAGYLVNARFGALVYNLGHSFVGPVVAVLAFMIAKPHDANFFIAAVLVWVAHIGLDRALGYGLKFPDSFQHTHLGMIGKAKQP